MEHHLLRSCHLNGPLTPDSFCGPDPCASTTLRQSSTCRWSTCSVARWDASSCSGFSTCATPASAPGRQRDQRKLQSAQRLWTGRRQAQLTRRRTRCRQGPRPKLRRGQNLASDLAQAQQDADRLSKQLQARLSAPRVRAAVAASRISRPERSEANRRREGRGAQNLLSEKMTEARARRSR